MRVVNFVAGVVLATTLGAAQATLYNRGGGMIYDDVLKITWLQDANYAKTSGYDVDGLLNWNDAFQWADSLTIGGYTDWRLPNADPVCNSHGREVTATSCTASELGNLFYVSLENSDATQPQGGLENVGPFSNLEGGHGYWTSTEFDSYAYYFHFASGFQAYSWVDNNHFALAVRDGDVSLVPAPPVSILTLTGLGLLGLNRRFRITP